ncbi:MAG TPA: DUF6152 family protein [Allosphingosinicella sp.]|jgi:hypothetical protein
MTRAIALVACLLTASLAAAPLAAHHGWAWATDEEFDLSGTVKRVRHGNPHGEMVLGTPAGDWTIEIGQPWRNEQAGLKPDMLKAGTRLTLHGHRSARKGERLMKAERIVLGSKSYNLYPDRPS